MLTAGFIQFAPKLADVKSNIAQLDALLKDAAGADLIVIPELANSGYNFQSKVQAINTSEKINKNGPFVRFLIDRAKKYSLVIVSGMNEQENEKLYNTSIIVGPNGVLGKYRKIHLFMNEFDYFEKGNLGLPVFDIGFCKIGMLICFDWIFPEVWRILALKGADIICHPSNLVLPYAQQAVPVYGIINKTFNITANRFGTERELTFSGQSIISDTKGKILARATTNQDNVSIVDINPEEARNKMITNRNHIFNDRFPEEYLELLKNYSYKETD